TLCVSVCFLQNAKPFPSSDSLAKVQEVASWLLEMNQDLLSGGSSSRRSRGLGGQAVRGNASSTTRAPQQAAEDDEDEHVNRVVEEEELRQRPDQPEASQADGEREQPWAPGESGASNGPHGEGEEGRGGPLSEVTGDGKGSQWQWGTDQQRQLQGQRPEQQQQHSMDQDSDEFEHSEGLRSPSLRNSVSAPSRNQETGCPH
uniref:Uncharacterized protein n=1 Tax=Poecilia formosa TaxID=48698 RepID=A0A096LXY1_POEFO